MSPVHACTPLPHPCTFQVCSYLTIFFMLFPFRGILLYVLLHGRFPVRLELAEARAVLPPSHTSHVTLCKSHTISSSCGRYLNSSPPTLPSVPHSLPLTFLSLCVNVCAGSYYFIRYIMNQIPNERPSIQDLQDAMWVNIKDARRPPLLSNTPKFTIETHLIKAHTMKT